MTDPRGIHVEGTISESPDGTFKAEFIGSPFFETKHPNTFKDETKENKIGNLRANMYVGPCSEFQVCFVDTKEMTRVLYYTKKV